jgi:hypothetical protein
VYTEKDQETDKESSRRESQAIHFGKAKTKNAYLISDGEVKSRSRE